MNTFGATGLVSRWTPTAGSTFYQFDPMGNVANYNKSDGSTTRIGFDAYGWPMSTQPTDEPYGFQGQRGAYTDSATGLILMGHRYYSRATCRWVTKDPIGYAGGINLYAYCGNNPVNYADPLGLCEDKRADSLFEWYMDGMGGLSDWLDSTIMGGQANDLGRMQADYDSGLLSGWVLAGGYVSLGTRITVTAGITVVGGEIVIGLGQSALAAAGAGAATREAGFTPVGRVFGGDSGPLGRSWTDPSVLNGANPRGALGLPSGGASGFNNTGQYYVEGYIVDHTGVSMKINGALPLDGNLGGAVEYIIPNPATQVVITRGGGVNPPF